jgi:hypothetical protein
MSAAAILSVAARKAASEGKKVGAAALTLIALVVMSLTVFPGLNRATTDQMAEAPASSESSSQDNAGVSDSGSQVEVSPNTENGTVDDSAPEATTTTSSLKAPIPAPSTQAEQEEIKAVLESPSVEGIFNSDSKSTVLVFDQNYTAIGDNGLTAKFTFNPTSTAVFTGVKVEIDIDGYIFDFKPTNTLLFAGKYADKEDVYILVGDATYLYDEYGKKWSKSDLGKSRIKIEVVMEPNGTSVKTISLAMLAR